MRKPLSANRERGVWGGEGTVAPPRDFLEEPAAQFPPNHLLAPSGLRITEGSSPLLRFLRSRSLPRVGYTLHPKKDRVAKLIRAILPHPLPQRLSLDLFFVIQLLVFQDFVLPQMMGHFFFVDLLSPWLLVICVFGHWGRVLPVFLFAIVLLESHASAPIGLFFCFYWMIGVLLFSFRHHISWQNMAPWLAAFFLSQVLLVVLEYLASVSGGAVLPFVDRQSWFTLVARVLSTTALGAVLVWRFGLLHWQELARAR